MLDLPVRYQAGLFVNANELGPTPENVSKLMSLTTDLGLLPSTFHEIGSATPAPTARLRLATTNNSLAIDFGSERIDIEKTIADPKGSNMGSVTEFCELVNKLAPKIFELLPRKAHRFSLVTRFLLHEMPEDKMRQAYLKLFRPMPTHAENPPHEWSVRSVSEVGGKVGNLDERFNFITTVSRGTINLRSGGTQTTSERLIYDFDYNTTQKRTDARYGKDELKDFFSQASKRHDSGVEELAKFIS